MQEDEVETSRAADEGRITSNPGSDREDGDGGRVVQKKKKKKPNQMKKKKKMKKKVAARPSVVLRVFEKNEPPAAVEAVQEEDEEEARRLFEEDRPPEKEDQEVLTPPEPVQQQQPTKKEKEDQTCPGDKYENEPKPTRAEIYQKWSLFLASKTPAELARWNQSDREQAHKDAAEYCGVDVVYFKETVFGSKSA